MYLQTGDEGLSPDGPHLPLISEHDAPTYIVVGPGGGGGTGRWGMWGGGGHREGPVSIHPTTTSYCLQWVSYIGQIFCGIYQLEKNS